MKKFPQILRQTKNSLLPLLNNLTALTTFFTGLTMTSFDKEPVDNHLEDHLVFPPDPLIIGHGTRSFSVEERSIN